MHRSGERLATAPIDVMRASRRRAKTC